MKPYIKILAVDEIGHVIEEVIVDASEYFTDHAWNEFKSSEEYELSISNLLSDIKDVAEGGLMNTSMDYNSGEE